MCCRLITTSLALLLTAVFAVAQEAPVSQDDPAPAAGTQSVEVPAPADEEKPLEVTVVSVSGSANYKTSDAEDAEWTPIKAGQTLPAESVINTGLGAELALKFEERGEITISGPSMIGLANLVRRGDTVTSEIGLKFGSMKARVDSSQGPNEFHISTPEGTLSVRGSFGRVSYFVDKGLNFCDVEGIWRLNTNIGKTNVQPGECTDNKLTPSTVISSRHRDTRMGDPNGGTTRKEEDNLRNNGGGRGIFSFSGSSNNQVKLYGNPPMPSPSSSSGSCQCPNGGESSGN